MTFVSLCAMLRRHRHWLSSAPGSLSAIYIVQILCPAVEGIDAVIHLAALFRTFTDNEGIIKTNHAGTVALANASIAAGVKRFIFASTGNVYGSDYGRPAKEDDTVNVN